MSEQTFPVGAIARSAIDSFITCISCTTYYSSVFLDALKLQIKVMKTNQNVSGGVEMWNQYLN